MANTTPRPILNGINDRSAAIITESTSADVQDSTPYVLCYAERGPFYPIYINGSNKDKIFGSKTFDVNSEYATAVTDFVNVHLKNGSDVLFQRCPLDNLSPASIRLAVELVPTKLTRSVGGVATQVLGYSLLWHVLPTSVKLTQHYNPPGATETLVYDPVFKAYQYRSINSVVGGLPLSNIHSGLPNPPEYKTLLFPVLTTLTRDQGVAANSMSLSLGVQQPPKVSRNAIIAQGSLALEIGFKYDTATILSTLGEASILVNTNPDGTDQFGRDIFQPAVVDERYAQYEGIDNVGSIGEFYLHDASIRELQKILINGPCGAYSSPGTWLGEAHYQAQDPTVDSAYAIDLSNERRYTLDIYNGRQLSSDAPLWTVSLEQNKLMGDVTFGSPQTIRYSGAGGDLPRHAAGSIDQSLLWARLDMTYREIFNNLETDPYHLTDMVARPFGWVYDAGFSLDTKRALMNIVKYRKDVIVVLSTMSYGEIVIEADPENPNGIICDGATPYVILTPVNA